MRKLTILIAFLMAVLFTGTAFASDEQEQLIHEQFGTGSYATWLRDDGTWDNGKPETLQSTKPHEYSIPAEKLKNCKLTRIEVKTGYSFDPEAFEKAGGWQRLSKYEDYEREILRYTPDNLTVTDTHDLATGKVNVTWSLRLSPTQPPENKREARETVDLNVREHLRQLGFKLEDDKVYEDFREGWLWCLPVHIQWYGVPKAAAADLDLAVTVLDPGVPTGEKAKPGQQYTGTVVYENLSGVTMSKPAAVSVTHQGYKATLKDQAGNVVSSLILPPGESETLIFNWHGPTDANSSTIKATINLPPDPALPEINLANNEKTVTIPVQLQNLKIEITEYTKSAEPGEPVSVGAKVTNQSGEMIITRLITKINDKIVSDKTNFDIISQQEAAANFTMPDQDATVEFIVNPDKNKPPHETTWNDNTATCTIIKEDPIPARPGEIKVKINAPNRIDAFNAGNWNFSVNVSGYFPPPPKRSSESRTATVTLRVTGSSIIIARYHLSNGLYGDVIVDEQKPVKLDKTVTFDVVRGKEFNVTKNFTFPWSSGFPGQDYPIPLHAKASWRSYSGEDATKVLTFREKIDPSVHLTR